MDADTLAARLVALDGGPVTSPDATGPDGSGELAVLDAREEGAFAAGHLFRAVSVPLSRLELVLETLVPRRSTPVVWCDGGATGAGEARRAAHRAAALGWSDCSVLDGGTAAWVAAGQQLYAGLHVPSAAFAELVHRSIPTPRITPSELAARLDRADDLVVLDVRPADEVRRGTIPGAVVCPGGELVHRIRLAAPDPSTTVVITDEVRSGGIVAVRSLLDAGVPNPVLLLEHGALGWQLDGRELVRGIETEVADPGEEARAWARRAAAAAGDRHDVPRLDPAIVRAWRQQPDRTTHLFDVRTRDEFAAGHLAGSLSAPGGELVRATDRWAATLGARMVLLDDDGTRATLTAAWLRRMGWDAAVVSGGLDAVAGGEPLVGGASPRPNLARVSVPVIRPAELHRRLEAGDTVTVLDVGSSRKYRRRGHLAGAWWGVRSRLDEARAAIGDVATMVLTSSDGTLARLAVPEAAERWPEADVLALAAGNKGWRHAGFEMEPGFERATTAADDVWYRPTDPDPDPGGVAAGRGADHLARTIGLADQVDADPLVTFPVGPPP